MEALTRAERAPQTSTDQELIAWFSTSICLDEASLLASWWFALYCGEPWALAKLRAPTPEPCHSIETLRRAAVLDPGSTAAEKLRELGVEVRGK